MFEYTDRIEQDTDKKFYQPKKQNQWMKGDLITKENYCYIFMGYNLLHERYLVMWYINN